MSLTAAALKKMLELGLTLEQAVELAEVWEAGTSQPVPQLSAGAVRTRKWRERLDATGATPEEWRVLSAKVIARDNGCCQYCGTTKGRMACDHVTPLVQGGDNSDTNLVCACHACNGGKSGKTLEEWRGAAWAAQWRADRTVTSRDVSHVGERTQVVVSSLPSLRSEEVAVAVDARDPAPLVDDWPKGNASAHAKALIAEVGSPWLDPHKALDLNTTLGRIAAWKRLGASWEFDVVPTVAKLCQRNRKPVKSWKFFDDAVAQSVADNRAALEMPEARGNRPTGPPRTIDEKSSASWDYAIAKIAQDEQRQN